MNSPCLENRFRLIPYASPLCSGPWEVWLVILSGIVLFVLLKENFLKWQLCHFPVMAIRIVVLIYLNVFLIYLLVVLSLISIFFNIYWGWPSFGLKQFLMVDSYCATIKVIIIWSQAHFMSSNMMHQKKKKKKSKLVITDLLNQLSHLWTI